MIVMQVCGYAGFAGYDKNNCKAGKTVNWHNISLYLLSA